MRIKFLFESNESDVLCLIDEKVFYLEKGLYEGFRNLFKDTSKYLTSRFTSVLHLK